MTAEATRKVRLGRLVKAALLSAALIYLLLLGRIYFFQRDHIYFPPPKGPAFDIQIKRPDLTLGGWVIPGEDSESALIVFGGNAMSLSQWGHGMLRQCTRRNLILVPYRGYEGNPGAPSEAALIDDGRAVVAWASERYKRVGVFGVSLGSGVAVGVASNSTHEIDTLLLGTPYDSMTSVARDHMPWAFPSLLLKDRFDSLSRISSVKAPIFALGAQDDTIILPARTAALRKAASGQWTNLPGGHDSVWGSQAACDWMRQATR